MKASFEEYCGRNVFENVTDGTIRWSLNVAAPNFEEPPQEQCNSVFSFFSHSDEALEQQNLPYFVFVDVQESHLRDATIPQHGCLVEQQIVVSMTFTHRTLECKSTKVSDYVCITSRDPRVSANRESRILLG